MINKKATGGLGRGLEHLFNTTETDNDSPNNSDIMLIHVMDIKANQHQPRKKFKEESLKELANSIKNQGIVQPLIVRTYEGSEHVKYEIVAGERRFRAAKMAGINEVPVIVRDYTDAEAMTIALIENLQREI